MSRLTVERWRREVAKSRHPEMTPAVKVLLLYLADHMRTSDRKVSVPRETVAKDLGCHESGVAKRYGKAVAAEYLTNVLRGHTGRTAVYQAILPDCVPQRGTQSTSTRAGERTHLTDALGVPRWVPSPKSAERESPRLRTPERYTNKETDLSVSDTGRDVGSYDEHRDQSTAYGLTVCDCHGFTDCANLPNTYAREESA